MSITLVFTKSFPVKQAILPLVKHTHQADVHFFTNRVRFLVCSVLITEARIVLDCIESSNDDVKWIYSRFKEANIESRVNFLVKKIDVRNVYVKGFKVINDLKGLCDIFTFQSRKNNPGHELNTIIKSKLKQKLSVRDYQMIISSQLLTNQIDHHDEYDRRYFIQRRYLLRKKLNLSSLTEFNSLVLMAS